MNSNVENFVKNIYSIPEQDYGDFMRTSTIYLNQFRKELPIVNDINIDNKLVEIQTYLQFKPNYDIKETREKILQDAKYINDLLQAHVQDWES